MNLLNTHQHKLVFRIDKDAPSEFIKRWETFKNKCETGSVQEKKSIMEKLVSYCEVDSNKSLPYLDRCEGGLGGDNNILNKQIRLRRKKRGISFLYDKHGDDILLDQIYSTDTEKWTYDELDDLILAFIKTANQEVKAECVSGCIEIVNYDFRGVSF